MGFADLQPILQSLLESGKYSDLTISCEGQNFEVHRAIVCSQSPFFKAAVRGGFKETSSSQVELPDDKLATIQRVISFLYNQDYDEISIFDTQDAKDAITEVVQPCSTVQNNFEVFLAADKFDIPSLKTLAKTRLIDWIEKNPEKLSQIVRDIWVNIPPFETELKNAIINAISYNADTFLKHDEGIKILSDLPELTIAVLKETVDENTRLKLRSRKMRGGW
ncbi:hypothetical protein BDV26DRAFT_295532 [Aspergillus bertholletiae]|uniref:BTB domain-containing protein n=1 Tax=Aspergillus bertholletiae TaxID=1226010 RepID=A0A5N7B1D0_9EURO|nr:hypothetical protein BDV26DRAFT_295532 [Aspergillus bertholletiae]